jgi:AcrR family transcriptional regulator
VRAARRQLIDAGLRDIKIEVLARKLGVTTGSFYWHFKSRDALFDALIEDWSVKNTTAFFEAVGSVGPDPRRQYLAFFRVWIMERGFDPNYDNAVRNWARNSPKVAKQLRKIDDKRLSLLEQIFVNFGFRGTEANIRARITYYHQVGYYAMNVKEKREIRLGLMPYYAEVLTDDAWLHELDGVEAIKRAMLG